MNIESVDKFGGTSMARPEIVADRVNDSVADNAVLVVSAPGAGPDSAVRMTDELRQFYRDSFAGNIHEASSRADGIMERMDNLYAPHVGSDFRRRMLATMKGYLNPHDGITKEYAETRGEVFSAMYLAEMIGARYEDSMIHLNKDGTINREKTDPAIREQCALTVGRLVVPGFIAVGAGGQVSTLGNGGSDRTGTNYARALGAVNTNWTDGGIASADPKVVDKTYVLSEVTKSEVHEAHFGGSRVLQGNSVNDSGDIEIVVRSTFDLEAPKTHVVNRLAGERDRDVAMVTGKTDLLMANIYDPAMAYIPGYISRVLGDFAKAGLSFEHMPAGQGSVGITLHIDPEIPDQTLERIRSFKESVETKRLLSKEGYIDIEQNGVVYVVGEPLRERDTNRDVTIRVMQAARSIGASALPVSNGISPSIALLTERENVYGLIKTIHQAEVEK